MILNYRVIEPECKTDFREELLNCLFQIRDLEKKRGKVFKLSIFIDAGNEDAFYSNREVLSADLHAFFKDRCPAFNILAQKPYSRSGILIEAGFVGKEKSRIEYKNFKGYSYVVISDSDYTGVWAGGLGHSPATGNIEEDSNAAFQEMVGLLLREGMTVDHVVRQWNYVGEILKVEKRGKEYIQNYQVFNEIRSYYYKQYRKAEGYPAATGIGTAFPGVSIDFFAIHTNSKIKSIAVNNEKQYNAYAYGQDVLVGTSLKNCQTKQPPQFERARLLITPNNATLFLSGTASIIGQETIGKGNLNTQMLTTFENLRILSESPVVKKYIGEEKTTSKQYRLLRIYVKNESDFEEASQLCERFFPAVPKTFVKADVCRDDLLIEIEGEEIVDKLSSCLVSLEE